MLVGNSAPKSLLEVNWVMTGFACNAAQVPGWNVLACVTQNNCIASGTSKPASPTQFLGSGFPEIVVELSPSQPVEAAYFFHWIDMLPVCPVSKEWTLVSSYSNKQYPCWRNLWVCCWQDDTSVMYFLNSAFTPKFLSNSYCRLQFYFQFVLPNADSSCHL